MKNLSKILTMAAFGVAVTGAFAFKPATLLVDNYTNVAKSDAAVPACNINYSTVESNCDLEETLNSTPCHVIVPGFGTVIAKKIPATNCTTVLYRDDD
jgi:hypothetical protein